MIGLGAWGAFRVWRGGLAEDRWFLRACVAMGPAGFVSVVAGWTVAEVGRQPFVIYGVLRTADAVFADHQGRGLGVAAGVHGRLRPDLRLRRLYILRLMNAGPVAGAEAEPPAAPRPPGYALAAAPREPEDRS